MRRLRLSPPLAPALAAPLPLLLLIISGGGLGGAGPGPALALVLRGGGAPGASSGPNASSSSSSPPTPRVHVTYAADREAFVGLLPSMISLARGLRDPGECTIHLFVPRDCMPQAQALVGCLQRELEAGGGAGGAPQVTLYETHALRPASDGGTEQAHLLGKGQELLAYWDVPARLPDVDRIIKLDTDTIIQGDVSPLYGRGMDEAVAAFLQPAKEWRMLNAGVLLMDLRRWRRQNITAELLRLAAERPTWNDQALLNLEFPRHRGFQPLELRWNLEGLGCARHHYTKQQLDAATILHWSGPFKPWLCSGMDAAGEFYRHVPRSRCDAWPFLAARERSTSLRHLSIYRLMCNKSESYIGRPYRGRWGI